MAEREALAPSVSVALRVPVGGATEALGEAVRLTLAAF